MFYGRRYYPGDSNIIILKLLSNYQFITSHKSDNLNDQKLSQELKDRIIYE